MKKAGKRVLFGSLLLVVLMFTMTFTVFAARNIPKEINLFLNEVVDCTWTLNRCEYIKIASAKGLDARIYYESWDTSQENSTARISISARNAGTHKLILDIYDALTNKKKKSTTIKIYAYENPIDKVFVNSKEVDTSCSSLNNYKKSTFTFKVQLKSGDTLKKLEYETYGKRKTTTTKNGNMTETITQNQPTKKSFKNGGSVPVSKYGPGLYIRDYEYDNGSKGTVKGHEMSGRTSPPTTKIIITYIDKYTKKEVTTNYQVYFHNN